MLLEKGANINAEGGWYGSALQAACEGGHDATVKILLEKGAVFPTPAPPCELADAILVSAEGGDSSAS